MKKEEKIEKIKDTILKFMLPDCLKPEYDGMTARSIAEIILNQIEEEIGCRCSKCGDPIKCIHSSNENHVDSLCCNCV